MRSHRRARGAGVAGRGMVALAVAITVGWVMVLPSAIAATDGNWAAATAATPASDGTRPRVRDLVLLEGETACARLWDNTIRCWGELNFEPVSREAGPPSGTFTSLNGTDLTVCASRADGTATCWKPWDELLEVPAQPLLGASGPCGIEPDGTLTCWGEWADDPAPTAPAGTYTAVNGYCGIRTDGTLVCWPRAGDGSTILADTPDGTFTALSSGMDTACAIRDDGTVACWGDTDVGVTHAPNGKFISVDVGEFDACGVRANGKVVCWGDDREPWQPLKGTFASVSVGYGGCAVRADGTFGCWGDVPFPSKPVTVLHAIDPWTYTTKATAAWTGYPALADLASYEVQVKSFALGSLEYETAWHTWRSGLRATRARIPVPVGRTSCFRVRAFGTSGRAGAWSERKCTNVVRGERGIDPLHGARVQSMSDECTVKVDGHIACWGEAPHPPDGTFTVIAGDTTVGYCAIGTDGSLTCWGNDPEAWGDPPEGTFRQVSSGDRFFCGQRTDGTSACWGDKGGVPADPGNDLLGLDAGERAACRINSDGEVTCWGPGDFDIGTGPAGSFSAISVGGGQACAVRDDHAVVCWGWNGWGQTHAPDGAFTAVSAGGVHTCAIRTDHTLACWGGSIEDDNGVDVMTTTPPPGTYQAVDARDFATCAIRTSGAVVCWGDGYATVPDTATASGVAAPADQPPRETPPLVPVLVGLASLLAAFLGWPGLRYGRRGAPVVHRGTRRRS